ncbi:hypothetical protein BHM03_00021278 [Ensete ventricosum]|nr:hypothetical protein BHM03_00021278 [Ensete ventricosum]
MGVVGEKDFGTVADVERTGEQGSCSNSASNNPTASSSENQDAEARGNNKDQDKTKYSVPFYKLFSFADSTDIVLMILGSLGAMGNGLALPIMTILFGSLIQSFGGASNLHDVIDEVSKLTSTFFGGFIVAFAQGWLLTLVMLCTIPPLVIAGGAMANIVTKMASRGQAAYGDAANVVEQTIGQIAPCMTAFAAGQAAAYKMFETIKRKPEIDAYDAKGKKLDDIHGDIELRDVYFSYPARPDEQIFRGFSLFIQKGTTVALVGESGSGKSTVISLIERFYDPNAGEVLIDGINLKEFQLKWIRGKIGLVSQEPLLKNPDGAYSQLIRLQEVNRDADNVNGHDSAKSDVWIGSARSSSKKMSFQRSLSRGSSGRHSSSHSFQAAVGLPVGIDVQAITSEKMDPEIPNERSNEVPLRRLAYLNKPEIPVLMLGSFAAIVNGVIFPMFAILLSNVIKAFYEPPHKLKKDSNFWSLMFLVFGVVSLIALPARSYLFGIAGSKLIRRIRLMTFQKVVNMEIMYEEASQVANDAVGSIRTVASFSAEEKVMEIYKQKCEAPTKKGIRQGLISGAGFGISFFLLFCVYAASFYAGARLVESGKTTFDKVFRVCDSKKLLLLKIFSFFLKKSASASVFAILDRESKIDPSDESGMTLERLKGNIEFHHVSFKYPTRPDIQIFQDLCLRIQSGKTLYRHYLMVFFSSSQTVALVGESGSGKSTVISLLQRFYSPDSGEILVDGIEIQKIQLRWLRQQMGLVSQEPALFNDTIRANIAYGKEGKATEAEIIAAAELANAHKFISSLQKGYDTLVGERGVQLSGGQKQRVAIARAIVKEPKILLLDEATSALDAESERVVQDALDRVMVNRTTVVVAHRLSTIKGADLIAVVKNGMIIEKGKHETLINIKDGAYASLVALHMSAAS